MSGLNKKPQVLGNSHVHTFLGSLSKADIADILVAVLRREARNEVLDDVGLLAALQQAADPVMRLRGGGSRKADVPFLFRKLATKHEYLATKNGVADGIKKRLQGAAEAKRAVADAVESMVRK